MQNKSMRERQFAGKIRKADIVLIAVCMLASVLVGIFLVTNCRDGNTVRISCDGEQLAVIEFDTAVPTGNAEGYKTLETAVPPEETGAVNSAQKTRYYIIRSRDGKMTVEDCGEEPVFPMGEPFNLLAVSNGTVRMEAADCRDQICVRHHAISSAGESIICLPHKLAVEITDSAQNRTAEPKDGSQNAADSNLTKDPEDTMEETLDGVVE